MNDTWPWVVAVLVTILLIGGIVLLDSGGSQSSDGTVPEEIAVIQDGEWVKGNPDAAVTLIEYSDFQCPACGSYFPIIKELVEQAGDRVRFVYRHFPLTSNHPNATPAAQAAEAAGKQGKFWEMHDLLFERQAEWSEESGIEDMLKRYAEDLELNVDQFTADLNSDEVDDAVDADRLGGNDAGVNSTPTFIANGQVLSPSPGSLEEFLLLIDQLEAVNGDTTSTDSN